MNKSNEKMNPDNNEVKSFLDHLEELRWVLIKSVVVIAVTSSLSFFFAEDIFFILQRPLTTMNHSSPDKANSVLLRALHPAETFLMSLKISFTSGLILASPIILYFLWSFVVPALTEKERRISLPLFFAGVLCFLAGVGFCYFVVLKMCLYFFWRYTTSMGIRPEWTIGNYISFVAVLLIAFGIAFQMPVVTAILAKVGLLTSKTLSRRRPEGILVIFIAAAILTPPDVFSQILLAVPMIALYEISILTAKIVGNS